MYIEEMAEKSSITGQEMRLLLEELKISKEEIQKRNDELVIANQMLNEHNEQLNHLRLYAESIVATIREPILVLNSELIVISANRSFYTIFQTTERETEGKLIFELGNKQWDIPALRKLLEEILPEHISIVNYEVTHDFLVLGERIMLLNAKKIIKERTEEQSILLAIEDITEKRKIEKALMFFTEELERKVSQGTISLNEANMDLVHSDQNLEQYAFIASHDLQEPLRKIRIFSALLETRYGKDLPESCNELISLIAISAERMSMLITGVLSFSKILHGEFAFVKTDLDSILSKVLEDFDLLITEKKATVLRQQLPIIDAIPMHINQLFYNLISNSLKFSRSNVPPVIEITTKVLMPDEILKHANMNPQIAYCEINFRDNGIGFQQQYSDQIFDIFKRLHSLEQFPGTGIGLAQCKKIVMKNHGNIYGTSNEGGGALFQIILPLSIPS